MKHFEIQSFYFLIAIAILCISCIPEQPLKSESELGTIASAIIRTDNFGQLELIEKPQTLRLLNMLRDSSREFSKVQLFELAKKITFNNPKNSGVLAFADELRASIFLENLQTDSAIKYSELAFKLYSDNMDTCGMAKTEWMKGIALQQEFRFEESLNSFRYAYQGFSSLKDTLGIVETMVEVGYLLCRTNQLESAMPIYNKAAEVYKDLNDIKGELAVRNLLAETKYLNYNSADAIRIAKYALFIAEMIDDQEQIAFSCNIIGLSLIDEKKYDEAEQFLLKCLNIKIFNNAVDLPIAYYNLARGYYLNHKSLLAKDIIAKSILLSKENPVNSRNKLLCYKLLSEIQENEKDYQNSLANFKQYVTLNEAYIKVKGFDQMEEARLNYNSNDKEKELFIANENQRLSSIITRIIFFGSSLVLLLAFLYFIQYRDKVKEKQQLIHFKLESAQRELSIHRELLDEYSERLADRNKKPEIDLIGMQNIVIDPDPEHDEFIEQLENSKLITSEDWFRFTQLYNSAYPGFLTKLNTKLPNLTAAEQRILLLMKMGKDSRGISSMLGISQESARKAKYRLRKKLEIDDQTDTLKYINQLI